MKKLFITATIIATLFAGSHANLFAQGNDGHVPVVSKVAIAVGRVIVCIIALPAAGNGQLEFKRVDADGNVAVESRDLDDVDDLNADASFQSIASTPTSTTFKPVSLNLSGTDPDYGSFTFNYDATRPPTNSTVSQNQPDAQFPATADIYLNITGSVSGIRGTYTNTGGECHLRSTNLQSFNPQTNETYEFVNDVTLTNADNADAPTITIDAGTQVVMN